jgi:hypothetical protein
LKGYGNSVSVWRRLTRDHAMHVGFEAREFFVEVAHKAQVIPSDVSGFKSDDIFY